MLGTVEQYVLETLERKEAMFDATVPTINEKTFLLGVADRAEMVYNNNR